MFKKSALCRRSSIMEKRNKSEKLCKNSSLKDLLNCSVLPDTICAAAAALPGPNGRIEGGPTPAKLPGGFGVFPFKSGPPLICKEWHCL